jgi:cytochrome c-type biogenesis protein
MSVSDLKTENAMLKRKSFLHTLFFLIGFSVIFIAIGFSATFIGTFFADYQDLIRQVGAILIVFLGFIVVGLLKPEFLMKDRRLTLQNRPAGYFGSFVIGLAFAAGWTPCTGPILLSVFALATSNPGSGIIYMTAYILGFAIPFFILSFFIGQMQWIKKHNVKIMKIGGYLMIFMGIFLYFDWMTRITIFFTNMFGGFQGF